MLVEDIVDTGLTLAYLLGELRERGPASLEVCTLLDKQSAASCPCRCASSERRIADEFVLGYGLDIAGRYRNLDMSLQRRSTRCEPIPTCSLQTSIPAPECDDGSAARG